MYGKIISGIGGGIAGGLNAGTQNDVRAQELAAYSSLPNAPDLAALYNQGYAQQNAQTPDQVYQDFKLRSQYAPAEQQQALNLYSQYAPQYAQQNLATLNKVDPQYVAGYKQLGGDVSSDLSYGSQLTPQQLQLDNANIAGAEASRGNILGNDAVSAQGLYDANAQNAMYQQRLGNESSFLQQGGPESRFGEIGGNASNAALNTGMQGLTNPGTEYYQIPQNLGQTFAGYGQQEFSDTDQNAMAQANAAYNAVPQVNPWIASLAGASAGFSGAANAGAAASPTNSNNGMGGFGNFMGSSGSGGASNFSSYGGQASLASQISEPASGGAGMAGF